MRTELSRVINHNLENSRATPRRIFVGTAVKWDLSERTKEVVAQQIHSELNKNREHMHVIDPRQLTTSMNEGRFVLILGEEDTLLGCAQVSEDPHNFRRMIVGTWLGNTHAASHHSGSGLLAIQHAAELALTGYNFYGAEEVVTRIKADNIRPQELLKTRLQTPFIGQEISPITNNLVNVYDLTHIGLRGVY